MVPTFNAGLGLGQYAAPQRDWRTTRIGPAPAKEKAARSGRGSRKPTTTRPTGWPRITTLVVCFG